MRLPSLSTRKTLTIAAAILAAVLVFGAILLARSYWTGTDSALPEAQTAPVVRPIFSLTGIEGIEGVFSAVRAGSERPSSPRAVRAAVLPHHTVPATKLMELWTEIEAGSDPSVIVIIGPNHENAGEGMVQTTRGVWTSPFGTVETDDGLVDRLVSLGVASEEPDSFVNEHAVGTHVSYVANLFPDVPILPIIAKSPAGSSDALSLALVLQQILPDDALVVSSIDFCHFLPQDSTDAMDAETLTLIAARRYPEIEGLGSDHVDTPYALIAFLQWSDRNGMTPDLVWHDSSHRLLNDANAPGTSYLAFFSGDPEPQSEIALSFVGDIMLGRGVATSLAKTTVSDAFGSASGVLSNSDIAFGNLESVLTSSNTPSGKEIYFHAEPERTDALQYLGITHVSVTNNHVDDYGRAGWDDSLEILNAAGIVPIGDYYNQPEPVVAEANGREIVFLAYDDLYRPIDASRLEEEVTAADALGDVLIVSFHWGNEYQHNPTKRQKELGHTAIDAGADIVVGHHPHVLQGIEAYDGGLIMYSLGNFIFDQVGEDENESMVARIDLEADGSRSIKLIPMRITGGFPREADDEERASTLERVAGWSSVSDPESIASEGNVRW